jgi:hypothetical protein
MVCGFRKVLSKRGDDGWISVAAAATIRCKTKSWGFESYVEHPASLSLERHISTWLSTRIPHSADLTPKDRPLQLHSTSLEFKLGIQNTISMLAHHPSSQPLFDLRQIRIKTGPFSINLLFLKTASGGGTSTRLPLTKFLGCSALFLSDIGNVRRVDTSHPTSAMECDSRWNFRIHMRLLSPNTLAILISGPPSYLVYPW